MTSPATCVAHHCPQNVLQNRVAQKRCLDVAAVIPAEYTGAAAALLPVRVVQIPLLATDNVAHSNQERMMIRLFHSVCAVPMLLSVLLVFTGCATLEQTQKGAVDKIGAYPLTARNEVEMLDLAQIVVEHIGQGALTHHPDRCQLVGYSAAQAKADEESATPGRRLDQALNCFASLVERNPARAANARNQIQERMLAASEQRCADYKMYVQRSQSVMNFASGTLTSLFAAAGAITKHVADAKAFASLAGFSGAVAAEYNQAYFANLAAHVVAAGIDRQRARIYEQIYTNGQSQSIEKYNLLAAIRDAFRFHGACSMITGLNEAQESIRVAENPGLDAAGRVVVKAKHLQDINAALPGDVPKVIEKWKDVLPPDRWLAGVPLTTSTRPVANEPAQAANLLAERLVHSASAPGDVQAEVDRLATQKPALMKKGGLAAVFAIGIVKQAADAGEATGKELALCKAPTLATASTLIDFMATRASSQAGKVRDKIDVEIRYAKAEQDRQMAAITGLSANVDRCVADARNEVLAIDQIADAASQDVITAQLAKIEKTIKACTSAKDQKAGEVCPPPPPK